MKVLKLLARIVRSLLWAKATFISLRKFSSLYISSMVLRSFACGVKQRSIAMQETIAITLMSSWAVPRIFFCFLTAGIFFTDPPELYTDTDFGHMRGVGMSISHAVDYTGGVRQHRVALKLFLNTKSISYNHDSKNDQMRMLPNSKKTG